jgi:AraC-like DNA-binding protein
MIGTPNSIAATPQVEFGGRDLLAEMLGTLRLNGAVFLDACFSHPFGIISPREYDPGSPMARLRQISIFHLIADGTCHVETAGGERRLISRGDVLLLPFADTHRFWSGDDVEMAFGPDLMRKAPVRGMWRIAHGGGGDETRMVCGFIESSEFLHAPIFRTLPELIIYRTADEPVGALLASTVGQILDMAATATAGTELLLGRLMESLFVEVVRKHVSSLGPGDTGWFAALNDPLLFKALMLLHDAPAHHWTVEELAREVGASRTVLADRFIAVLGTSPMRYLAGWRIHLAADLLRNGNASMSQVAAEIGYESDAALQRAFKRTTGVSPGRWREGLGTFALPTPADAWEQ